MILSLNSYIDHTLLRPDASSLDIEKLCQEAMEYQFATVCINPVWVAFASRNFPSVKICSVVGFPLGALTTYIKTKEAEELICLGASEVDMVINIGALKEGNHKTVVDDISSVVCVCPKGAVKVILETCLLSDEEKVLGAKLCIEAGAGFVKTSTGFSSHGAVVSDVKLLSNTVQGAIGVKASGGIRDRATAEAMIEAGACRLGTSSGVFIMQSGISKEDY